MSSTGPTPGPALVAVARVSIDPADVGRRVTVRRRIEADALGDVVGRLISWGDDDVLTICRRTGEEVRLLAEHLVAARVVAPEVSAADLQQRCAEDVAPRELQRLVVAPDQEPWLLRWHEGANRRSCSALALTPPTDPAAALAVVHRWYAERGAVGRVLVVEDSLTDRALRSAGTASLLRNHVMTADIPATLALLDTADAAAAGVEVGMESDAPAWLLDQGGAHREALASLHAATPRARYGVVRRGTTVVGAGRVHARGGWAGITSIGVDPEQRGHGAGTALIRELLRGAAAAGAGRAWLQVERSNVRAVAWYRRLGFVVHHHYRYAATA